MALAGRLRGEMAGGLGGPPQRRHRIAAHVGFGQGQQRVPRAGVQVGDPPAAPAGPTGAAQWRLTGVQLHAALDSSGNRLAVKVLHPAQAEDEEFRARLR